MMSYDIQRLSDELVLIKWHKTPAANTGIEERYLQELKQLLDQSPKPLYFISDLRQGRIINVRTLRALGQLTGHKNWAGSTAFSQNPVTKVLVNSFKSFAAEGDTNDEMQNTPEEALAFLEKLKPGLVRGIAWDNIIQEQA